MISVICPSRARPGMAWESYKSFKQDVEFLLAVDEDDPGMEQYKELGLDLTICSRWGYGYMEKYCNLLAAKATGEWLLNWNDDAFLESGDLDELVADLDPSKPIVVLFGGDTSFPLISRGLYDLLGRFAGGPSVDSYIHAIGVHGDIIEHREAIKIRHDKDSLTDQTAVEKNQALKIMDERMDSLEVINNRLEDIRKVRALA